MAPAVPHDKAIAAIMGGFCADAATYPVHWIYDLGKVKELLQGKEAAPEFFPTPSCPFYNSGPTGSQSCYGDELIPLLKSMADNGGEFSAVKFSEAVYEFYTKTSPQSYKNKSIRTFLAAFEEGKRGVDCGDPSDSQANCFAKVPLLLARYAGQPDSLKHVEEAIRTQQNNADAVKYGLTAAKILEKIMLGDSASAALAWARDTPGVLEPEMQQLVAKAVDASRTPPADLSYTPPPFMKGAIDKLVAEKGSLPVHTWSVWSHGPACSNPAALTNVLMMVSAFSGKGSSGYVDAVRANLAAAGDNASRVLYIGATLAAEAGSLEAVPQEWKQQTAQYEQLHSLSMRLLQ